MIQLERHNERLKDALLRYASLLTFSIHWLFPSCRLRDAAAEHEGDLNRKIKDLERENHELGEIKCKAQETWRADSY